MQALDEALQLLKRQAELERVMAGSGRCRIQEEEELRAVQRRLTGFPEAIRAVLHASHALRRPVDEIQLHDVESWAKAG